MIACGPPTHSEGKLLRTTQPEPIDMPTSDSGT